MPPLRSRTVTHGRNMAGARALLRATGVASEDFGKPIIAVANSFTEFVPGHVHLADVGRVIQDAVRGGRVQGSGQRQLFQAHGIGVGGEFIEEAHHALDYLNRGS